MSNAPATGGRANSTRAFVVVGVLVALVLAFFVSPMASKSPDGLNKVAADHSIDANAKSSAASKSPTANYEVKGIGNKSLSKGISGVIGVLLTLVLGWALFASMKRMRRQAEAVEARLAGNPQNGNAPPAAGTGIN